MKRGHTYQYIRYLKLLRDYYEQFMLTKVKAQRGRWQSQN